MNIKNKKRRIIYLIEIYKQKISILIGSNE